MLMVMPSRLATELNGESGLFIGLSTTSELYMQLFGMEFPAGHQAIWNRDEVNSLTLSFRSPWFPPSGEVMGEMSQLFDCEIRHYWISPEAGTSGYNCFDRGDHVDSGPYPAEELRQLAASDGARMYLVTTETAAMPAFGAAHYGSIRA